MPRCATMYVEEKIKAEIVAEVFAKQIEAVLPA